jgi:DNA-binding Lrp family transcriptional regulator
VERVASKEDDSVLPQCFVRYDIDEIDLYILNKLHNKTYGWQKRKELSAEQQRFLEEYKRCPWKREGASVSTLNKDLEEELGVRISRPEVEARVERLAAKGVITSLHSLVINPVTLYDNVFFAFWKIPLSQTMNPFGWWDIGRFWEIDKSEMDSRGRALDLIRILGVPEGTGSYDFVSLVYENDLNRHRALLERLQARGFLVSSTTQRVWQPTPFFFDPIKIPDYDAYTPMFKKYYQKASKMSETHRLTSRKAQ